MQKIDVNKVSKLPLPIERQTLQNMVIAVLAMLYGVWRQIPGLAPFPSIWLDIDGKRYTWWPMPPGETQDYSGYPPAWFPVNFEMYLRHALGQTAGFNAALDAGDMALAKQYAATAGPTAAIIWNIANDWCRKCFNEPTGVPDGGPFGGGSILIYSPLQVPNEADLAG